MNQNIITAFLLSTFLLTSCATQSMPPAKQTKTTEADFISDFPKNDFDGLQYVELSSDVKQACNTAIENMELMRDATESKQANNMIDAQNLIFRNISIANPHIRRACVEYDGWFLFSRLNTAGPDDGSFKTGIAVKKGSTEIYKWK